MKHSETDERSESRSSDGGGLDKQGDSSSDEHSEVSVDVGGFVDDTSRSTEEHFLKKSYKTQQADDEKHEGKEETDSSGNFVVVLSSSILEEGGAFSSGLVALDKSHLSTSCLGDSSVDAESGVESVAVLNLSGGDVLSDLFVGLDDEVSEGRHNSLERSGPFVAVFDSLGKHGLGQVEEVSGDGFKGKQNNNCQEVEHVVHGGSTEGALELVSVSHLSHGDNGVGYRSSDVGSHDHVDGLSHSESSSDESDNDGGRGRAGLQKHSGQDTNHKGSDGVGVISEQRSSCTSSDDLGGRSEQFQTQQEKVQKEKK